MGVSVLICRYAQLETGGSDLKVCTVRDWRFWNAVRNMATLDKDSQPIYCRHAKSFSPPYQATLISE